MAKRIVHYVNQFFAGIGGEEKADTTPHLAEKLPPISVQLGKSLGEDAEVVGTVVCGDGYFNENLETAKKEVLDLILGLKPDLVIAGPAFNAGRYGMAAGQVVLMVQEQGIDAFTAMYDENPGVDVYKKAAYIVRTSDSAAGMRKAIPAIAKFAKKMLSGEPVGRPNEEGYIERGIRINSFSEKRGATRAVDMLVKKLKGEEFETEYPMPAFDRVEPGKAIKDITKAKIAVVTSGGTVPKGNPDHVESSSAQKYGKYEYPASGDFDASNAETAHGGYDPTYANTDNDRVVPLDVLKDLEKEGKIGELFNYYYSTVGNGTAVASSKKFAAEIAQDLLANKVDAVILTST